VWFGTDLVLDAFRFIFTETQHGLFQVHSYPFDESTSTFIVECAEPVWRRARLDQMSEQESLEFCQRMFAEDLGKHRLLSNKSVWLDFLRVSNRTWRYGNIVLLGDAAHTAHFSIGSGTKLAMEDAIALANACVRQPDVRKALVDYELERQPAVERVQRAADESAGHFARVVHSAHMAPRQFAANLLTRSGRISHAGLAVRDPEFVRALDAWFARDSGASSAAQFAPPPLFAPLQLGSSAIGNRAVVAGRGTDLAASARTGAGLVTTGMVAVSPDGRISARDPVLDAGSDGAAWRDAVDAVHEAGSLAMVRLGHAGRRGATEPRNRGVDVPLRAGGWPLISASAVSYGPYAPTPKAMDADDFRRVRGAFADAASLAAAAGFDAIELDAAHGYLLASFLSPLANRRDDDYAGSLENRLRFPLEVLAAVRESWPDDRLLAVRLTVTDWARGGVSVDEGIEMARAMAAGGARLIHVEAGQAIAGGVPDYRRGYLTTLSDRVRNEARVPTLVGGYLTTLDEVNTAVVTGRADLCLLDLSPTDSVEEVAV
jgi:anthraniloyl-CoA monooxygenase